MEAQWRKVNLVCSAVNGHVDVLEQPMTPMRDDLLALFERSELAKYLTEEELPAQEEALAEPEVAAQPEVTVP
jgi:succinate dehydrogenase / fumarate reductase flavoprotein subunit